MNDVDGDDKAAAVLRSYLQGDPTRLTTILTDPAQARAVAADAAPGDPALRNALIAVSQLRATRALSDPASPVQVLRSLASRLEQDQGIGTRPAQRAIIVWVAAIRSRSVDDIRRLIQDVTPPPLDETSLADERHQDPGMQRRPHWYVAAAALAVVLIVGVLVVTVRPFASDGTSTPGLSDFFTGISATCKDRTADWPGVDEFDASQVIGCDFPLFIADFHKWPTAAEMKNFETSSYHDYQSSTVTKTTWKTSEGKQSGDFYIWSVAGGYEVFWTVDDLLMSGRMFARVDSAAQAQHLWETSPGVQMDDTYLR